MWGMERKKRRATKTNKPRRRTTQRRNQPKKAFTTLPAANRAALPGTCVCRPTSREACNSTIGDDSILAESNAKGGQHAHCSVWIKGRDGQE